MATGSYVRAIYRIEARTDSPARARGIVKAELGERMEPARLQDVELLVSELVTNVVRHGGRAEPVTLDLRINGNVRCAVTDHGPGPAADELLTQPGPDGWGLKLVERLSTRWGLIRAKGSTQVWFETSTA
jgi:anti-sigma regulatory factor (Ser/Thr protein kinase)